MLKVFRDNLKYLSWILWLVIAIFVAFIFVDWGIGGLGNDQAVGYAAKVGGETVSMQDFERTYRQLENQYRELYGERFSPEVAQQLQLPMQALDRLVSRQVLLQEARAMDLAVSDEEVRHAILALNVFQGEDGAFIGDEDYAALLRQSGHTPASFERSVREDLLVSKLTGALEKTVQVTDAEVERAYRERAERAAVRFVLLPESRFQGQVGSTPAELEAHYQAHREDFRLGDQRIVDYLLVDAARLQQGVEVSSDEARAWYDSHAAEFTQPEQVRARHILLKVSEARGAAQARSELEAIRQRIAGGEDFAAIARAVSEDPASGPRGGELGTFGRGQMVPEFEQAAFGGAVGELVGPIETSFGLHLLQVEEKLAAGTRPFAEVQAQIVARLRQERAQAQSEAKAKELYAKLASGSAGQAELQALADAEPAALSFATTPAFGRDDLVPGVGRQTAFTTTAFALEQGKLSEPVRVPRGWALLVLREVKPPRVPEFAEAEAAVRQAVERQKRTQLARAEAERARAAMADGKTLDTVATEFGVAVQESGEFGADGLIRGLGLQPALAAQVLAGDVGSVGVSPATAQGVVLYQVTERKRFDALAFASERAGLRDSLAQQEFGRLLQSLIESRRAALEVNYNRQLLQQFGILGEAAQPS